MNQYKTSTGQLAQLSSSNRALLNTVIVRFAVYYSRLIQEEKNADGNSGAASSSNPDPSTLSRRALLNPTSEVAAFSQAIDAMLALTGSGAPVSNAINPSFSQSTATTVTASSSLSSCLSDVPHQFSHLAAKTGSCLA